MKKIIPLLLCVLLFLCSCASYEKPSEKPDIVTTVFPLYDFAKHIGGDKVNVKMLISPGCEVHTFDPAPSDMTAVINSDLFLYIGGESDVWVNRLLSEANVNPFPLITSVKTLFEDGEDEYDEHIWTSPENAVIMIEAISEKMSEIDTDNAEYYKNNAQKYCEEIKKVSFDIRQTVNNAKNSYIVVADRFPFKYFTNEYGIEYSAAFGGCATSTDISVKTMARLLNDIKTHNVKCAYFVEMSNKNIANAIEKETGIKLLELHSAHNVTLKEFESGITYLDIIKANQKALEEGMNL